MDIKELKGTISPPDFVEGLIAPGQKRTYGSKKTCGQLWEDIVACGDCPYKKQCDAICAQVEAELDVSAYCNQVIDYLLGDISIEDFVKET